MANLKYEIQYEVRFGSISLGVRNTGLVTAEFSAAAWTEEAALRELWKTISAVGCALIVVEDTKQTVLVPCTAISNIVVRKYRKVS